jgi:hypothetical protein
MIATEIGGRALNSRLSHGRVVNAIAEMFRRQLSIPHIFLEPRVPGSLPIDVLAVDRAGSGDVHGVQIKVMPLLPTETMMQKNLVELKELDVAKKLPVNFKYLAIQANEGSIETLQQLRHYESLFDPSGIGRVGILAYNEQLLHAEAEIGPNLVSVIVAPERFRIRGEKFDSIEKFLSKAKPDVAVRI